MKTFQEYKDMPFDTSDEHLDACRQAMRNLLAEGYDKDTFWTGCIIHDDNMTQIMLDKYMDFTEEDIENYTVEDLENISTLWAINLDFVLDNID